MSDIPGGYNPNASLLPQAGGPIVAMSGGGGDLNNYNASQSLIPETGGTIAAYHGGGFKLRRGGDKQPKKEKEKTLEEARKEAKLGVEQATKERVEKLTKQAEVEKEAKKQEKIEQHPNPFNIYDASGNRISDASGISIIVDTSNNVQPVSTNPFNAPITNSPQIIPELEQTTGESTESEITEANAHVEAVTKSDNTKQITVFGESMYMEDPSGAVNDFTENQVQVLAKFGLDGPDLSFDKKKEILISIYEGKCNTESPFIMFDKCEPLRQLIQTLSLNLLKKLKACGKVEGNTGNVLGAVSTDKTLCEEVKNLPNVSMELDKSGDMQICIKFNKGTLGVLTKLGDNPPDDSCDCKELQTKLKEAEDKITSILEDAKKFLTTPTTPPIIESTPSETQVKLDEALKELETLKSKLAEDKSPKTQISQASLNPELDEFKSNILTKLKDVGIALNVDMSDLSESNMISKFDTIISTIKDKLIKDNLQYTQTAEESKEDDVDTPVSVLSKIKEKFREIRDKINAKNIEKYKQQIADQIVVIESLENQIREESKCCAELPGLQGQLNTCYDDLAVEKVLADERLEEVKRCNQELQEAKDALTIATNPEEIAEAEGRIKEATNAKTDAENKLEEARKEIEKLKIENERLKEIELSQKECEEKLEKVNQQIQTLKQNGETKNELFRAEQEKANNLEEEIENLKKDKMDCDKKISSLLEKLNIPENTKLNLSELFGNILNTNFVEEKPERTREAINETPAKLQRKPTRVSYNNQRLAPETPVEMIVPESGTPNSESSVESPPLTNLQKSNIQQKRTNLGQIIKRLEKQIISEINPDRKEILEEQLRIAKQDMAKLKLGQNIESRINSYYKIAKESLKGKSEHIELKPLILPDKTKIDIPILNEKPDAYGMKINKLIEDIGLHIGTLKNDNPDKKYFKDISKQLREIQNKPDIYINTVKLYNEIFKKSEKLTNKNNASVPTIMSVKPPLPPIRGGNKTLKNKIKKLKRKLEKNKNE